MIPSEVYFAPRNRWLALLLDGWQLPFVADVMAGSHGIYAVVLERYQ